MSPSLARGRDRAGHFQLKVVSSSAQAHAADGHLQQLLLFEG